MNQIGRRFGLSEQRDWGVFCSDAGVLLGGVSLLERCSGGEWRPRRAFDLNRDLSKRYGLPVEVGRKMSGIEAIAKALGRGDLIHARIATLHLEIPDPPILAEQVMAPTDVIDLARQLRASGLLKADWDPEKHPRWPAGTPDSIGGEFAPTGTTSGDSPASELSAGTSSAVNPIAPVLPVQFAIPAPFEIPGGIPFPSEIVPPPAIPDIAPRSTDAIEHCNDLLRRGKLGTDEYRGKGRTFLQCVMGQVTEDCGGNPVNRS